MNFDKQTISLYWTQLKILFKQELKETFHSRIFYFVLFIYFILSLIFVFIATQESSVLGFTGINRILFSLCHIFVFIVPLLGLATTSPIISQYRENGTLEFYFSQPVSRSVFFVVITLVRFLLLSIPLLVILLAMLVIQFLFIGIEDIDWVFLFQFLLINNSLIWCFLCIGLFISEKVNSHSKALIYMLLVWITAICLMDFIMIGLLLQFSVDIRNVFYLAVLNPIQSARLALLSGIDTELSNLGPVGFFVANEFSSLIIFLLGCFWPFLLGVVMWLITFGRFKKNDIY